MFYQLSFLDLRISSLESKLIKTLNRKGFHDEVQLLEHLEKTIDDLCAFLSITCDYEVLPIYFDYFINNRYKYFNGQIIPIDNRRRISRISSAYPKEINLLYSATAYLECYPIDEQLSRGIQHLKLTVDEATIELKLMAACSAIEYFYSYWLFKVDGISKLIRGIEEKDKLILLKNKTDKDKEDRKKEMATLQSNGHGRTPPISKVIRFFLRDIGVDYAKYADDEEKFKFLEIRNSLLHGSFMHNEILICVAEDSAQKLGSEILYKLMKIISKSKDVEAYDQILVELPLQEFCQFALGWEDLRSAFNESSEPSNQA
ncbi:MAG: hypothetical protein IGS48_00985 [Oscillatoriales cyanobacterium C42_A2020_001]|nr:hypothetical protein [Leptolyngbyaceae cyanobacterium C42_A2020_001]